MTRGTLVVSTIDWNGMAGFTDDTFYSTMMTEVTVLADLSSHWSAASSRNLPAVFTGGWVGYAGYDTVRYVYGSKIPFSAAPTDDRGLPDLHFALYRDVIVFDNVLKMAYVVAWVDLEAGAEVGPSLESAYLGARSRLATILGRLKAENAPNLSNGRVTLSTRRRPQTPPSSTMTREEYLEGVARTKEYIQAGDVFQLVLAHRFERRTYADPFEIYRALRVVNPSPYMVYLQARGCILTASSPEILCRLDASRVVTNRPLAGTRPRGATPEQDRRLEEELLADEKEKAEHVMLVDLGRNDVGKVAKYGTVKVERLMEVERYSHVMHISSTVTGQLRDEVDCWGAMRAALPAGTVSGAPKVRAMQIIDELERTKRGPYAGGMGHVSFHGAMDLALALRTLVVPTAAADTLYDYVKDKARREWNVHLQVGAGLVADSDPAAEYEETVNKAAALGRAIDLAESTFVNREES